MMLPTPTTRDYKSPDLNPKSKRYSRVTELNTAVGGLLNPDWVEWLMGLPVGWTIIDADVPHIVPDDYWDAEPDIPRVSGSTPHRADRLKCLGNMVVPQQFYPIFAGIAEIENNKKLEG